MMINKNKDFQTTFINHEIAVSLKYHHDLPKL